MSHPMVCEKKNCERPAIIGIGQPPIWLCMQHYEEDLAALRDVIDRSVRTLAGGIGGPKAER